MATMLSPSLPQPPLPFPSLSPRLLPAPPRSLPLSSSSSSSWSLEQRIEASLSILDLMTSQSLSPDPSLLSLLLRSCTEARSSRLARAVLRRAHKLFDEMTSPTVESYTNLISMYHNAGFHREALGVYLSMKDDGSVRPNAFTYTTVLNSCASVKDLEFGIEIHNEIVRDGCESDGFVAVALIDMYAKCGCVSDAREMFDKCGETPSAEACTAMVEGYSQNGKAKEAMELIRRALHGGLDADELGYATVMRPCVAEMALKQGQEIHAHMIKTGHKSGMKTLRLLVELYESCDKMVIAKRVFDDLAVRDLQVWGRMISGFVRSKLYIEALKLYVEMVSLDIRFDSFAVCLALKACVGMLSLEQGKQLHASVVKVGLLVEDPVVADLAEVYSSCGESKEACRLTRRLLTKIL
ncbi:pentatricopeptide repeat-containing protein At5g27110-like [Typha latifolia]|uniref:pentatricopeptide repeat-containing protein At5g27110-like n=1 Tax=Typha latifolia TaxID=4733 RepID=UPI003C30D815